MLLISAKPIRPRPTTPAPIDKRSRKNENPSLEKQEQSPPSDGTIPTDTIDFIRALQCIFNVRRTTKTNEETKKNESDPRDRNDARSAQWSKRTCFFEAAVAGGGGGAPSQEKPPQQDLTGLVSFLGGRQLLLFTYIRLPFTGFAKKPLAICLLVSEPGLVRNRATSFLLGHKLSPNKMGLTSP